MKNIPFSILMITTVLGTYAQNYQISFTGTGGSTMVDSVKIENLSQCSNLSIAGTDTLNLSATVGIIESGNQKENYNN